MTTLLPAIAGMILAVLAIVALYRFGLWFWRNGDEFANFENKQAERLHGRFSVFSRPARGWIYKSLGVEFILACCGLGLLLILWITEQIR